MANPEHVKILLGGTESVREWLGKNPKGKMDASGADLTNANLSDIVMEGINFSTATLVKANMSGSFFRNADFSRADLTNAYLDFSNFVSCDFSHTKLVKTSMSITRVFHANLSEADLSDAELVFSSFSLSNLTAANIARSNLMGADLSGTILERTNFSSASLMAANFLDAEMCQTNFTDAHLSSTIFADCDLSQCLGLDTIIHTGPSSIDIGTLQKSFAGAGNRFTPALEKLFLNAGVPKELLTTLPQIFAKVRFYTCFVCYGEPDKAFAEKLTKDLKSRGVQCWVYSMDSTPGERIWGEITQRRREAEKMIVLCSAKALVRDGVKKEIEEQIAEEPEKIIPISLDNLWKDEGFVVKRGESDLKPFLLERNYADFADPSFYEASLCRLLEGLKKSRRP